MTLRSDDDVYRFMFGPTASIAGRLPHVVMLAKPETLTHVLRTLKRSGGAIFDTPPFNPDGSLFNQVLTDIEAFKLWREPVNQKALAAQACHAKLGGFTMVIDLATPLSIVERFYESWDPGLGPHITNVLPMIVERIEDFRWACFPIEEEFPLAMFVARPADSNMIDAVEAAAKSKGLPCTRIVKEQGRFTWHLPHAMRTALALFGAGTEDARLSNADFVADLRIDKDAAEIAIAAREILAAKSRLCPEQVTPDLSMLWLFGRMSTALTDGFEPMDFTFELEQRFGRKIRLSCQDFPQRRDITVQEWFDIVIPRLCSEILGKH